jgi:hypothetical protein
MKLTDWEKAQIEVAKRTLKMSDPMVPVMGSMTKERAKEILETFAEREQKEMSEKI